MQACTDYLKIDQEILSILFIQTSNTEFLFQLNIRTVSEKILIKYPELFLM